MRTWSGNEIRGRSKSVRIAKLSKPSNLKRGQLALRPLWAVGQNRKIYLLFGIVVIEGWGWNTSTGYWMDIFTLYCILLAFPFSIVPKMISYDQKAITSNAINVMAITLLWHGHLCLFIFPCLEENWLQYSRFNCLHDKVVFQKYKF